MRCLSELSNLLLSQLLHTCFLQTLRGWTRVKSQSYPGWTLQLHAGFGGHVWWGLTPLMRCVGTPSFPKKNFGLSRVEKMCVLPSVNVTLCIYGCVVVVFHV
eukprot:m.58116 g.58116  ORF g.58116 m.58116 type:complete len:102 (-) comp11243_c0_seq1:975-1280(-)